jgi:hypothetical protein
MEEIEGLVNGMSQHTVPQIHVGLDVSNLEE